MTIARFSVADATKLPLEDHCADLVIGSPPYAEKGDRYDGARRKWGWRDWGDWMVRVTQEALRACCGPVVWVVNSPMCDHRYRPAVERLLVLLDDAGIELERPCIWTKNPLGRRRDWFSNAWEYVIVAKRPGPVHTWNWSAIAEPPKYRRGGAYRSRDARGERRVGNDYPQTQLARPTDVLRAVVGGGHMGHKLSHENEAPYPESIVRPFILTLTNPGDIVVDPFSGSGTTAAVAVQHGRHAVGFDIRRSQVQLSRDRVRDECPSADVRIVDSHVFRHGRKELLLAAALAGKPLLNGVVNPPGHAAVASEPAELVGDVR